MSEKAHWLGFSVFPGVGPARFKMLLSSFGTAKNAWNASVPDLKKIGIGDLLVEQFEKFRRTFSLDSYENKLSQNNVSFLILSDSNYPKSLAAIPNPPFVLYVKSGLRLNDLNHLSKNAIAVVGTRKITQYGREVTEFLTRELVQSGFTIISGLAVGVDAVAHKSALENEGKTIAVLGCGVDCCFPRENEYLYNAILEKNGVVVSELPLGHAPTKGSFLSRNRIVAGLSQGVLVTEGAEDSGSLVTAGYAREFGRKVFSVPGPITSQLSKGPYDLIAKGAKLVTRTEDIIQELGLKNSISSSSSRHRRANGETKEEKKIIDLLEKEALHFDQIVRELKMSSATVGGLISMMEIKGIIQEDSGSYKLCR